MRISVARIAALTVAILVLTGARMIERTGFADQVAGCLFAAAVATAVFLLARR